MAGCFSDGVLQGLLRYCRERGVVLALKGRCVVGWVGFARGGVEMCTYVFERRYSNHFGVSG